MKRSHSSVGARAERSFKRAFDGLTELQRARAERLFPIVRAWALAAREPDLELLAPRPPGAARGADDAARLLLRLPVADVLALVLAYAF